MSRNVEEEEEEEEAAVDYSPFGGSVSRGKKDSQAKQSSLWLITFTDVMALMLTFFVLLYSMAVPEEEKWTDMTDALNDQFNKFYSARHTEGPQVEINIDKLDFSEALSLGYLRALIEQLIREDKRLENVVLIQQKDRLIISMPHDMLFDSGKAEVKSNGKKALFSLGGPLSRIRNRIEVVGHADPNPIESDDLEYKSNWELSLARAIHVAAVLENVGYRRPIAARGLSSGRYEELPLDLEEETRLGYARRVDIAILKDDGSLRQFGAPVVR